jgi:DNA-binding NarL/FixJ family response regulator
MRRRRNLSANRAALFCDTSLLHQDLLDTIRAVRAGRKWMSPEVAAELADYSMDDVLTAADVEMLRLISQGCGNKEIAARLSGTEHSVKSRVWPAIKPPANYNGPPVSKP